MARACDICGKRPITGWNPQSVGMNRKRALRRWLPNLQRTTLVTDQKV
jgi:ribosomal protein L28